MLKFAFSVILVGALYQAFVFSIPADTKANLPQSVEIVSKAALDIFKSVAELGNGWSDIIKHRVNTEMTKLGSLMMLRVEMLMVSTDPANLTRMMLHYEMADAKRYQIIAKSVEDVFAKLDKMELANKLIGQSIREVINQTKKGDSIIPRGGELLYSTLDKNFKAEKELSDVYQQMREKNEKDDSLSTVYDKVQKEKNFGKVFLNYVFAPSIYYRPLGVTPRDHFLVARSIVELAKDATKLDKVQSVYDATVLELADSFDSSVSLNSHSAAQAYFLQFFQKLEENFVKEPSLSEEFKSMKKEVSKRNTWDRSVLDPTF